MHAPPKIASAAGVLLALAPLASPAPALAAAAQEEPACRYELQKDEGRLCIRKAHFNADLCGVMEQLALTNDLPPAFFARLIWRESLFRPEAVSPKGAEGIAQFMPSTARARGLENSFDVVRALNASAEYLDDLRSRFGSLGFAAIAYNAGEGGLSRFLATGRLPIETRDYVYAITGSMAETWRDAPPPQAAPALDEKRPFRDACTALADTRRMKDPVLANSADWAPWGVQLAAHYDPSVAGRLFVTSLARLPPPLGAERALLVRQRGGNFGSRPRYAARIGRETREAANKLCASIRSAGVPCTVFRN